MKVEFKKLVIFFICFFVAIAVLWPIFDYLISLVTHSDWAFDLPNDLLTAFSFAMVFSAVYAFTGR